MQKNLILSGIVLIIGIVGGWLLFERLSPSPAFDPAAPRGGGFTLTSESGKVSLVDFRGKVVLLYFGYTFCPDICPTSLARIAQALNALPADELERVRAIFISVDPDRDTPAQLARYAGFFHPEMIGLTGSEADIMDVAQRYGAAWNKVEGESEGGYLIDHTSNTYVVDSTGNLGEVLPHGSTDDAIVEAIRRYLGDAT